MSLFQCSKCGCCENTACSNYYWNRYQAKKHLKPVEDLCSACDPDIGKWHGEFERTFLPMGMFKTNQRGNLEHTETGEEGFRKYALPQQATNDKE
jgi:hypothetical protein